MLPLNGGQGRSCITQLPGGHDLGPVVPSAGPDSSSWTWNSLSLARPTREMFGHSSWGPKPLGSSHSWVLIKTLQYHGLPPPSCCHALCPLTARGLLTQLALGLAGDDHSIFFFFSIHYALQQSTWRHRFILGVSLPIPKPKFGRTCPDGHCQRNLNFSQIYYFPFMDVLLFEQQVRPPWSVSPEPGMCVWLREKGELALFTMAS